LNERLQITLDDVIAGWSSAELRRLFSPQGVGNANQQNPGLDRFAFDGDFQPTRFS
jgi:hypothetical protein